MFGWLGCGDEARGGDRRMGRVAETEMKIPRGIFANG